MLQIAAPFEHHACSMGYVLMEGITEPQGNPCWLHESFLAEHSCDESLQNTRHSNGTTTRHS